MKSIRFIALTVLCLTASISWSETETYVSGEEMKLYNLIVNYRAQKGLSKIPLSKSLTYVAQVHAKDLHENFRFGTQCNMHSWSNKGKWTPCCYTDDHAQAACMWNKPQELTSYKGYGYEISHGGWGTHGYTATAETALNGWKGSAGHNSVIVNEGTWARTEWNAIGIGIYKDFAVVWFGKELDQ